jgi:hypothetical protein
VVLRVLPWLVVAFLLSAGIRHTHTIDWRETVVGSVEEVVDLFADVERYDELMPEGAVRDSGFVERWIPPLVGCPGPLEPWRAI